MEDVESVILKNTEAAEFLIKETNFITEEGKVLEKI